MSTTRSDFPSWEGTPRHFLNQDELNKVSMSYNILVVYILNSNVTWLVQEYKFAHLQHLSSPHSTLFILQCNKVALPIYQLFSTAAQHKLTLLQCYNAVVLQRQQFQHCNSPKRKCSRLWTGLVNNTQWNSCPMHWSMNTAHITLCTCILKVQI